MTFKVNYGFQKAERDRAKQAKKDAKRREKEQAAQQESRGDHPGAAEVAAGGVQDANHPGRPGIVTDESSTG